MSPARSARGRRRGAGLVAFLLVGVLIAVGLVVADNAARAYAQREVAARLRTQLGTDGEPSVAITGTPFLTQVAANRFTAVDVAADRVVLTDAGVTMTLRRVRLHLTDVVTADSYRRVTATGLEGGATLGWDEASRQLKLPIGYAGGDRVQIDASQKLYGQTIRIQVTGVPQVDAAAQTLTLGDPRVELAGQKVPDAIVRTVLNDVVRPSRLGLPLGLRATRATATADGLEIGVTGRDVPLAG